MTYNILLKTSFITMDSAYYRLEDLLPREGFVVVLLFLEPLAITTSRIVLSLLVNAWSLAYLYDSWDKKE